MFCGSGLLHPKKSIMIEKGGTTDIFQPSGGKFSFLQFCTPSQRWLKDENQFWIIGYARKKNCFHVGEMSGSKSLG